MSRGIHESAERTGTGVLARLMMALFSSDELERFLGELPGCGEVVTQLPDKCVPAAERAWTAVCVLERHGLVTHGFWRALALERRGRLAEIRAARAVYGECSRRRGVATSEADDHWAPTLSSRSFVREIHVGRDLVIGERRPQSIMVMMLAMLVGSLCGSGAA